jgi:hypothetical protein
MKKARELLLVVTFTIDLGCLVSTIHHGAKHQQLVILPRDEKAWVPVPLFPFVIGLPVLEATGSSSTNLLPFTQLWW